MRTRVAAVTMLVLMFVRSPVYAASPASPGKYAEGVMEVTMSQLIDDAARNTIAAEQKYKGKRFRLMGLVKGVARGAGDEPFVDITDATGTVTIIAKLLPSELNNAAALVRDRIVTVECVGVELRFEVDLLNCRVVKESDGIEMPMHPPQWVASGKFTDDYQDYNDAANIVRRDNIATIWGLRDFRTPIAPGGEYQTFSIASKMEFDCSKPGGNFNAVYFAHYSENMGKGKIVNDLSGHGKWTAIDGDPAVLASEKLACGEAHK
ncbi:MAG: tRNA anti-like [Nevskia sp.]|nr:tRNA anti-like [Nevskia sp.]